MVEVQMISEQEAKSMKGYAVVALVATFASIGFVLFEPFLYHHFEFFAYIPGMRLSVLAIVFSGCRLRVKRDDLLGKCLLWIGIINWGIHMMLILLFIMKMTLKTALLSDTDLALEILEVEWWIRKYIPGMENFRIL